MQQNVPSTPSSYQIPDGNTVVLDSPAVKAHTGKERPDFLVVVVDVSLQDGRKKDRPLQSVFVNEFLNSGINYSNYKEVAVAFAVEGTVLAMGNLTRPDKFDPAKKLKALRLLRVEPVGKK